jgi:hypothetical protein
VYQAANTISLFPYDLLLISTHCGDAPGWRFTYKFIDSEGLPRHLVVDVAVGIKMIPGKDTVNVTQFTRFVSLDGVDWNDSETKRSLYVGTAVRDYMERVAAGTLEPLSREEVTRVPSSMALHMADGNYIALPETLASRGSPIVINNACASWHRLAGGFMFGNARCYLGTLFDVIESEAQEMVERLFAKEFGTELAFALWRAQNSMYGENVRRPYVMVGCHFQRC